MPVLDSIASFVPTGPGRGRFTLTRFNGLKELGNVRAEGIDLLVLTRGGQLLGDWYSVDDDHFINIIPETAAQRGQDFVFSVGPAVINPIALDNTGDYKLRIRSLDGTLSNFAVDMQGGMPVPDTVFQPGDGIGRTRASRVKAQPAAPAPAAAPQPKPQPQAHIDPKATSEDDSIIGIDPEKERIAAAAAAAHKSQQGQNKKQGPHWGPLLAKIVGVICLLILAFVGYRFVMGMLNSTPEQPAQPQPQQVQAEQPKPEAQKPEPAAQPEQKTEAPKPETKPEAPKPVEQVMPQPVVAQEKSTEAQKLCRITGRSEDDKTILSSCFKAHPTTADVHNLLRDALATGHCEIALRILRSKGRGNSGSTFAWILSQYADPKSSYSNSCIPKNTEEALYWRARQSLDPKFDKAKAQKLLDSFQ